MCSTISRACISNVPSDIPPPAASVVVSMENNTPAAAICFAKTCAGEKYGE